MKQRPEKSESAARTLINEFESEMVSRFGNAVRQRDKAQTEFSSTGIAELDSLTGGGLPRGAITEILGPASSGRTSLMLAILAAATSREEICSLVDATDSFDPASASAAGVDLDRLLWVRCTGDVNYALKGADLLLQSGGFGLVVLDLGDIATGQARKIHGTWWHRLRRAIENTTTSVLIIEREPNSRSSASLALELTRQEARWSQAAAFAEPPGSYGPHSTLVAGIMIHAEHRKPARPGTAGAQIDTQSDYMPDDIPGGE